MKTHKIRRRFFGIVSVVCGTLLFCFFQIFPVLAADEETKDLPPIDAGSEVVMPIPPEMESQLTEVDYTQKGCDENNPCPVGQTCLFRQCPMGVISETGCGECVDVIEGEITDEATVCQSNEKLMTSGGKNVCVPMECDQCAGNVEYECGESTNYKCVKHECAISGTTWDGTTCVCSDGSAPVDSSCTPLETLTVEVTRECRASGTTSEEIRSDPTCGTLGSRKYGISEAVIWEIDGAGNETETAEDCSTEVDLGCVVDENTADACPAGSDDSYSDCLCGNYREVQTGCYECVTPSPAPSNKCMDGSTVRDVTSECTTTATTADSQVAAGSGTVCSSDGRTLYQTCQFVVCATDASSS